MTADDQDHVVTIRPGVGMLGLLASMNYKPWYALSEFVDNAVGSRVANVDALCAAGASRLIVTIDFDSGLEQIIVADNAAGIAGSDVDRAFKSAEPPPDASGLSQFGIGMKAAACWYARRFTVTSTALGEDVRRRVTFDVPAIVGSNQDRIPVELEPAAAEEHGTTIVLSHLHRPIPQGQTLGKVRAYLGSIYRGYLGPDLDLRVKGEVIVFRRPPILVRPRWDAPRDGPPVEWKKNVEIRLGSGGVVRGWAALRETGSTREAGIALLYRDKVVVGAGAAAGQTEDHYRPVEIFGGGNSFVSQRLFGELDVSALRVTHSKDAVIWDGQEEELIAELKRQLDAEPMPLLRMATQHRVTERSADISAKVASAVTSAAGAAAGTTLSRDAPVCDCPPTEQPDSEPLPAATSDSDSKRQEPPRTAEARFAITYEEESIQLELVVSDKASDAWIRLTDHESAQRITVCRDHPFMRSFAHLPNQEIEPVLRLAVAVGLAELAARRAGVAGAAQVRAQLNAVLRGRLGNSNLSDLSEEPT